MTVSQGGKSEYESSSRLPADHAGEDANGPPESAPAVQFVTLDAGTSWVERCVINLIHRLRRLIPPSLILAGDLTAVFLCALLGVWLSQHVFAMDPRTTLLAYAGTYCGVVAFGNLFAGLYSGVAPSSPSELKRLTMTVTVTTLIMALVTFASDDRFHAGLSAFCLTWVLALFAVPFGRGLIRLIFSKRRWWGCKAIIMGRDLPTASRLVNALKSQPRLGIKPVAILSTNRDRSKALDFGLPQLHGPGPALKHAQENGIDYAIVTLSDLNEPEGLNLIRTYENCFKHWLIVPYFSQNYSLWVQTKDLNGMLGLEITNRLNRRGDRIAKRTMDLVLTILGGLAILPFCLLIALAIRVDSRGPILYSQERLGRNGKRFKALKFRSMVQDADVILHDYLEKHPELMEEWRATQKLKSDPRITKLGNFLRRSSLDELPQLINVLRGEMSLVGPRPIVEDEIERYGWVWNLYKRARPGITGQWQISGRNDTSYRERTNMDAYYIRNWSIWLDIHILARTISVVLKRDGAY